MQLILLALVTLLALPMAVRTQPHGEAIVTRIIRADYAGDRAALERLYAELSDVKAKAGDATHAARLHYWKGFAMWRRVINGFNENSDTTGMERDLQTCISDFEASRK